MFNVQVYTLVHSMYWKTKLYIKIKKKILCKGKNYRKIMEFKKKIILL